MIYTIANNTNNVSVGDSFYPKNTLAFYLNPSSGMLRIIDTFGKAPVAECHWSETRKADGTAWASATALKTDLISFFFRSSGGGGIGEESDPVWLSEKANYYTKSEADIAFLPASAVVDKIPAEVAHNTIALFAEASAGYTYGIGDVIMIIGADAAVRLYMFFGGDKTDVANYTIIDATKLDWSNILNKPALKEQGKIDIPFRASNLYTPATSGAPNVVLITSIGKDIVGKAFAKAANAYALLVVDAMPKSWNKSDLGLSLAFIQPGIACTLANATEIFTSTAHGLSNDDRIMLNSTDGAAGMPGNADKTVKYYVVEKGNDTFKLSLTSGGAAVDFSSNGTNVRYTKVGAGATMHNVQFKCAVQVVEPDGDENTAFQSAISFAATDTSTPLKNIIVPLIAVAVGTVTANNAKVVISIYRDVTDTFTGTVYLTGGRLQLTDNAVNDN